MTTAILSIHPRHAQAILDRRKTIELRRVVPRRDVTRLVIYETAPTQRVVAECDVSMIVASPEALWRSHGAASGVTRAEFRAYFAGRRRACGLIIESIRAPRSANLSSYGLSHPPQSWAFLG